MGSIASLFLGLGSGGLPREKIAALSSGKPDLPAGEPEAILPGNAGWRRLAGLPLPTDKITDWQWSEDHPKKSPPAGYRQAIAYDPNKDRFVMHGGWGENGQNSQTWVYQNGQWEKLEEGSTPCLHGHKMVDTPFGLMMYGGVKVKPDDSWNVSDGFYVLREIPPYPRWQKIKLESTDGSSLPAIQGMGMVYHPDKNVILLLGGSILLDELKDPPTMAFLNTVYAVYPASTGSVYEDWHLAELTCLDQHFEPVFEPLAFSLRGDEAVYLYGGLVWLGDERSGAYSTKLWEIRLEEKGSVRVARAGWPEIDYAGIVRGGSSFAGLLLWGGRPALDILAGPYPNSVMFKSGIWKTVSSLLNPPQVDKPAVAVDPKTGKTLFFGGISWDKEKAQWKYWQQTWTGEQRFQELLPLLKNK